MKILVIGGAGYIGSHVVRDLIKKDYHVVVLDNLSTGNKEAIHKNAKFYEGDQLNYNILQQIFEENKIDVVMHFSAKLIVPESVQKPIEYFENNVYGVSQILKAMVEFNVKNIVFSSTAAVYGAVETNHPIDENEQKVPIQPYGQSKLACEWLIQGAQKAHGINYAIFRYFNVAGSDDSGEIGQSTKGVKAMTHLIPVVMEVANKIRPTLNIFGNDYQTKDGTCVRDYIHVNDLAEAHILSIDYIKQDQSNIFNLGSNEGYSVLEILQHAKEITKIDIPSKIVNRRDGDPAYLVASNKKVAKLLNWSPKHTIKEIIESDYNWRKNLKF